jgi:hypothetical protein
MSRVTAVQLRKPAKHNRLATHSILRRMAYAESRRNIGYG